MTAEPIFRRAGRPPEHAPNVLAVVLDDTGFAQLGCFGSGIATPHIDRLAAGGLRYNRFHVTALCSPSRACFLTGRNHHAVGMGFLADIPLDHPGYTARIPRSAATLPRILRDHGYSTIAIGKWHLTPRYERSAAGPFGHWPLGQGFERYYGFLQGDTNHYAPNLVRDNHHVDPPATPEEGYHLTEDLVTEAVRHLDDQRHAAPGKPFFLYLGLGATHSPHHVAPEWSEPYRGRFDRGWDAWRAEIFRRQTETGVVPPGTVLTPRPDWVPAWGGLTADRRRLYARQQEVFAGFLTHADAQLGRLLAHLAETGRLDDTIIVVFSDNGASAEGGVDGSVNEHRFSAGIRESPQDNLAHHDDWGGPRTYNHYAWGWAWAGNTPFRLWKRYTWLGGTRTPLIVHWPAGIGGGGAVRDQIVHVNDLFPTLLDAIGIRAPDVVDGIEQQPVDGASFLATFADPAAPAPRTTQYFEMLGSRSLIHGRWRVTTDHVSTGVLDEEELLTGSRDLDADHWALFDLAADFSEAADVSAGHPEVVAELRRLWAREAGRNNVLPLYDDLVARFGALIGPAWPPATTARSGPGPRPCATSRCRCCSAASAGRPRSRRRASPKACCSRWATGTAASPCTSPQAAWPSPSPAQGSRWSSPPTARCPPAASPWTSSTRRAPRVRRSTCRRAGSWWAPWRSTACCRSRSSTEGLGCGSAMTWGCPSPAGTASRPGGTGGCSRSGSGRRAPRPPTCSPACGPHSTPTDGVVRNRPVPGTSWLVGWFAVDQPLS
ncbi:sulfatase-like hydrolase/transferase [Actinomadura sp. ATCC 39365]